MDIWFDGVWDTLSCTIVTIVNVNFSRAANVIIYCDIFVIICFLCIIILVIDMIISLWTLGERDHFATAFWLLLMFIFKQIARLPISKDIRFKIAEENMDFFIHKCDIRNFTYIVQKTKN